MKIETIRAELFQMQDLKYKDFHAKLMPTINPDTIIGVRTPKLRALAKSIKNNENTASFLKALPHRYYEENNLHAFLIAEISDFDRCIEELNKFLPYIDNWATCDGIRPKCFKKNTDRLLAEVQKWIESADTYTVRFAIEMLMVYFLDDKFDAKYLDMAASVNSDEYYINMMIAWYFATALAKQWQKAIVYIEKNKLPIWTHNKTIQKAVESYRITDEQKEYLRGFRRK